MKSMQAIIDLLKNKSNSSHSEVLKMLYSSKLSLSYHKNFNIVKKTIEFLQNINKYISFINYTNLRLLLITLIKFNYYILINIIYLIFKVFFK